MERWGKAFPFGNAEQTIAAGLLCQCQEPILCARGTVFESPSEAPRGAQAHNRDFSSQPLPGGIFFLPCADKGLDVTHSEVLSQH